ncbi:MAG: zinc ribbon domain-containing protein [Acidobacteria bacterium]|jgi:putative FmdB family regulatory protein|nr:zinc ribbon domain-containing protein [Acidobacteriota bacterium]
MPVYEFECEECSHKFQEMIPVSDWEKKQKDGFSCPECGSRKVEEVLSANVQTSRKS